MGVSDLGCRTFGYKHILKNVKYLPYSKKSAWWMFKSLSKMQTKARFFRTGRKPISLCNHGCSWRAQLGTIAASIWTFLCVALRCTNFSEFMLFISLFGRYFGLLSSMHQIQRTITFLISTAYSCVYRVWPWQVSQLWPLAVWRSGSKLFFLF